MKIVVLDGYTLNPGDLSWEGFESLGEVQVYNRTPAEKTVERIGDASVILTNKTAITKEILDQCPAIRYIGVLATGYNVVDVKAAAQKGIVVTNIPSYGTDAVAQYAFALLLELCHHVGLHDESVKAGEWENCQDFCYWKTPLMELAGKTLGLIGFGRIGQKTGAIARAMGMKVLAYDRFQRPELENENCRYVSLEQLLAASDVISLHCPLLPETKGVINRDTISRMKDGVLIINTSRGDLVVEKDLAEALISGKVAGAAADVVSTEPIKGDNPLLKAPNMIITPHMAWGAKESRGRLMNQAVENLKAFLSGNPVNTVS
ncbi:D-2-hydroxyacid dehydrogenase [Enterocloster clostridioformis]|uniref:D-2-hydroxyacid dehydrogenase n=1 Tax=Enterocloster clostridioformis TaxID=1531 RepID=UPI0040678A1A